MKTISITNGSHTFKFTWSDDDEVHIDVTSRDIMVLSEKDAQKALDCRLASGWEVINMEEDK